MKTSFTSHEITLTFCTLSTSLLLAAPLAARAEGPANAWYGPAALPTGEPGLAPTLLIDNASTWERLYGRPARQAETDYLASQFAANLQGLLKGPALYTRQASDGSTQRIGLLGGERQLLSNGNGIITRRAMADPRRDTLNVQGQSLGAFWSLTGAQGWHVDLSASGGRVSGYSRNEQGQRQATEGNAVTLSVEGGFPIGIGDNWVVEPQAQLINQRISLGTPNAGSGSPSSTAQTSWSGRVGARLKGRYEVNGLPLEPYVRTNLWHTVYSGDTLTLDKVDKISSSRKSSTVELGLGLVAKVSPTVSLYVSADYSSDVDDNDLNGLIGSLGVRMRW